MNKKKFLVGVMSAMMLSSMVNPVEAGAQSYDIVEKEPGESVNDAVVINLKESHYDGEVHKYTIRGKYGLASDVDWFKLVSPDVRGMLRTDTTGESVEFFKMDSNGKLIAAETGYYGKEVYLKVHGNHPYYIGSNYDLEIEYHANLSEGNPHEPNDLINFDGKQDEYAMLQKGVKVASNWTNRYDYYDNFGVQGTNNGKLTFSVYYPNDEFKNWKDSNFDYYLSYIVYAEKKDGTLERVETFRTTGMPNQVATFTMDVNNKDYTGKYVVSLRCKYFVNPNYEIKLDFKSVGTSEPTEPTDSKKKVVKRLSGSDRYSTNLAILGQLPDNSVSNVLLASGSNYPDALAGSFLLNELDAALVLVDGKSKTLTEARGAIDRIMKKNGTINVLGGDVAVSPEIERYFTSKNYKVNRISGSSRVQTSIEIAKVSNSKVDEVILAYGGNFADSLSVSPVSSTKGLPILLNDNKTKLNSSVLSYLKNEGVKKVTIVGGTAVVGADVEKALKTNGISVERLGGKDRYDTSLKIAQKYFNTTDNVAYALGTNFPDALSGATLSYQKSMPIILSPKNELPSGSKAWVKKLGEVNQYLLGGSSVISDNVLQ